MGAKWLQTNTEFYFYKAWLLRFLSGVRFKAFCDEKADLWLAVQHLILLPWDLRAFCLAKREGDQGRRAKGEMMVCHLVKIRIASVKKQKTCSLSLNSSWVISRSKKHAEKYALKARILSFQGSDANSAFVHREWDHLGLELRKMVPGGRLDIVPKARQDRWNNRVNKLQE